MTRAKMAESVWSVRKDGRVYAQSLLPRLGYSAETLREMAAARYELYRDGERVPGKEWERETR